MTPVCGCAGCRRDAAVRIAHPDHGELVVCEHDARGHEVVGRA